MITFGEIVSVWVPMWHSSQEIMCPFTEITALLLLLIKVAGVPAQQRSNHIHSHTFTHQIAQFFIVKYSHRSANDYFLSSLSAEIKSYLIKEVQNKHQRNVLIGCDVFSVRSDLPILVPSGQER